MLKDTYLDLLAKYDIKSAHPGGMALTRNLLRNESLTSETIFLDVGCGTGQTSAYIATHYPCQVIAIDINNKMLEKARGKFQRAHLEIPTIQADASDLPLPKNYTDILISESVITFTDDILQTLKEYYRVLRPGGIFLSVEGTALSPLNQAEMKEIKSVIGMKHIPTKEQWYEMFQMVGFKNIQVLATRQMPFPGLLPSKISREFRDYHNIIYHYRQKLGYGIYRAIV